MTRLSDDDRRLVARLVQSGARDFNGALAMVHAINDAEVHASGAPVVEQVSRYCVCCNAHERVDTNSPEAWGEFFCGDCRDYRAKCDAPCD